MQHYLDGVLNYHEFYCFNLLMLQRCRVIKNFANLQLEASSALKTLICLVILEGQATKQRSSALKTLTCLVALQRQNHSVNTFICTHICVCVCRCVCIYAHKVFGRTCKILSMQSILISCKNRLACGL